MRCNNCGWNNPDGSVKCQKCNQPLVLETIPLAAQTGYSTAPLEKQCPHCGYPITDSTTVCPACKKPIVDNAKSQQHRSQLQDSQKTVILDEINNEAKESQSAISKQTVLEKQSQAVVDEKESQPSPKIDLKKTVCDFSKSEEINALQSSDVNDTVEDEPQRQSNDEEQPEYRYLFECMDSDEHDEIALVSKSELLLSDSEVILISGLRFRKK